MSTIGQRLKTIRKERHLTHKKLAEMAGMCRQNYSKIEADLIDVPASRLQALAAALSVPPGVLLPRLAPQDAPSDEHD